VAYEIHEQVEPESETHKPITVVAESFTQPLQQLSQQVRSTKDNWQSFYSATGGTHSGQWKTFMNFAIQLSERLN
jgi:hypothetical protein